MIFRQNDYTVHEVLVTMVKFANEMEMLRRRPEVAVECYTETLEILYFLFLPGVLLCRARSLLKLVKNIRAIPLSSYLRIAGLYLSTLHPTLKTLYFSLLDFRRNTDIKVHLLYITVSSRF